MAEVIGTNARSPFLLKITATTGVILQLKATSFDESLRPVLGLTAIGDDGELPPGITLLGKGKLAAMNAGAFAVNLVYQRTASKLQTAKALVSPMQADTVFTAARSKTYNGKNIVDVRVPRRRIYSY